MKLGKRFIALAVVAVMLVSVCLVATAASVSRTTGHNVTSDGSVVYTKYSASGDGGKKTATVLTFNPDDGYIPMAFVSNPTSVASMPTQYSSAINNYGFEVPGMINGGYFTMATSTLEGLVITDTRLIATTLWNAEKDVVAFDSDGTPHFVKSNVGVNVIIDGSVYSDSIFYINKEYGDAGSTYQNSRMFYYDSKAHISSTSYSNSGIEVVFEKMDNGELSVGETLNGKVVSVKSGTKGGTSIGINQFVLFAKAGSTYASKLSSLSAGEVVSLQTIERVESSRNVMENANSVIGNIGFLVKDGVDQTDIYGSIGGHDVDTLARWTAFGIKADGSYVYFTSEGGSTGSSGLTLRDVADIMLNSLGCVDVVRMDGGGSTGMYLSNTGSGSSGYAMSSQRNVADCLLVVKKSSLANSAMESELSAAIAAAKNTTSSNPVLLNAVEKAESLIGTGATEGELRKALVGLSAKELLSKALVQCETLEIAEYSEQVLSQIRSAYKTAKSVYESASATDAQYNAQTAKLCDLLAKAVNVVVSTGASYTTTAPNRNDGHDDDQMRLTDGSKGTTDLTQYTYSGWNVSGLTNKTVNVDVDLGSVKDSNCYTVYLASGTWGINPPSATVDVYTSTDGVNYTKQVATTNVSTKTGTYAHDEGACTTYEMVALADQTISARYVRFAIKNNSNFTWLDEVEVSLRQESEYYTVSNHIWIDSFNTKIASGSSTIFTPSFGTLTKDGANHTWSNNIICEKQSDGTYVVVNNVSCLGDDTQSITLKSNQIMISAHSGDDVVGSATNAYRLGSAQVGQVLWLYGIDINSQEIGVAAYVKFLDAGESNPDLEEKPEDEQGDISGSTTNPDIDPVVPPVEGPVDTNPNPGNSDYVMGDINDNGTVDMTDYILAKRAYFGTYNLTAGELKRGDVNESGAMDMTDYILIKRVYFGTYSF